MIREARKDDKSEVYDVWKHAYPNHSRAYLNFYFKHIFDQGICIVKERDRRIVSSLQINEHVLKFHNQHLLVGYIAGVGTLPDYRRKGCMREIMESALDEEAHNHLITLIEAFNPRVYEPFGFETIYYHKFYSIRHEFLEKACTNHLVYSADPKELLLIYQNFVEFFDGSYVRDEQYYILLIKALITDQKKLIVYRDEYKHVKGYLVCQKMKNDVVVREAIYLESAVLIEMLKGALGQHEEILVEVSQSEKLEKIFPLTIPKKQPFIMARINNYDLFNKLFNSNVETVSQAYALNKKPLWLHEYY